jgi:hypothetical protein
MGRAGRSGSANLIFALVAQQVLGLNLDIVRGYDGAAPIFLAEQRGEVDGLFADFSAVKVAAADSWRRKKSFQLCSSVANSAPGFGGRSYVPRAG